MFKDLKDSDFVLSQNFIVNLTTISLFHLYGQVISPKKL